MIRRWFEPGEHEPATAFFSRIAGRNGQTSAWVFADEMGFDGRTLAPADCLDAVSEIGLEGMDRLIHATPVVHKRAVRIMGVDVRRRHWSEAPRVCPGCLAESAHHRTFHSLVSFTVCPYHGCGLVGGPGGPLAWWYPHLDHAPDGTQVALPMPRLARPRPSFELWLLGRLGVEEPLQVPILTDVSVPTVIDTIDLLGRAAIGGWRVAAPRTGTPGFERAKVVAAGFAILCEGVEALERLFDDIANQGEGQVGADRCAWGMHQAFGWLYNATFCTWRRPMLMDAVRVAAGTVAKRRGTFARSAMSLHGVNEEVAFLHRDEVARSLNILRRAVDPLALRLGMLPSGGSERFVMYDASVVPLIRESLSTSMKREEAAGVLGLRVTEFDALVRMGLLRRLCRLGGPTPKDDMYLRHEVEALLPDPGLGVVSTEDERHVDLTAFAEVFGLRRPEVIGLCAAGRLTPLGIAAGSVGLASLVFARPHAGDRDVLKPPAPKVGGRFRSLRSRRGMTKCDAASKLGINMATVAALLRDGLLQTLGAEESGTARALVDEESLRTFAAKYAPAVSYADVLGCGRTAAVNRLRGLGVRILLKAPGNNDLMAIVLRSDVLRALRSDTDPMAEPISDWTSFWDGFGRHLASKRSIFRPVRIAQGHAGRIRSGDRRTAILIGFEVDGYVVLRLETGRAMTDDGKPFCAERSGFVLGDKGAWLNWFEWIETNAYLARSYGKSASRAA
nr:TniQ family protein [Methylobacterium sp. GC_Met_2]